MPDALTPAQLAGAEAVMGVTQTEAERALMLDALGAQLAQAHRRRAMALPEALGPATRFDPRLPGFRPPAPGPVLLPEPAGAMPEGDAAIAFAPALSLRAWLRDGRLSSERLVGIYLERIGRIGPGLECWAHVDGARALERARALDQRRERGEALGPLHGLPYGMKDIIDVAGLPCEWGAEPFAGRVASEDAHVTRLLHEAGAVLLGKTTVGALAYGDRWNRGRTRNPWSPLEGSGGSSAGSASAVASGLCAFALGTETLGSIVNPSARCGAVGLRPTHGRVSRRGAMALCWSLDKIGPICRSVADTAMVLDVMAGRRSAGRLPDPPALRRGFRAGRAGDAGRGVPAGPGGGGGASAGPRGGGGGAGAGRGARGAQPGGAAVGGAARHPLRGGGGGVRGAHPGRARRPAGAPGRRGLAQQLPGGALPLGGGPRAARPAASPGDGGARTVVRGAWRRCWGRR